MFRLVEVATLQDVLDYAPGFRSRRMPRGNRGRVQPKAGTSGGAAPFSPADVAGLRLFLDAQFTDDVTLNTTPDPDKVSAWLDHTDASNNTVADDCSEATQANQPNYLPTGWMGTFPCVDLLAAETRRLTGSSSAFVASLSDGAPFTLFLTFKAMSSGSSATIFAFNGSASNTPHHRIYFNGATSLLRWDSRNNANATSSVVCSAAADANEHVITIKRTAAWADCKIRVDGVDQTGTISGDGTGAQTIDMYRVGVNGGGGTTVNPMSGSYAGVIGYIGALSDADCADVEAWLMSRWGLS